MTDGFRAQADALGAHRATGGFHTRATIEEGPRATRLVNQAVARAKEGEREAVRFLYLQYADNVYSYVRSIVRDEHEAEDVTQHVFAKLITSIVRYEQRSVPFAGWILRLAHNAAIDHLRGSSRVTPAEEIFGEDEHRHDDGERGASLRDALSTLPEEQRRVVVLRHFVGLTPPEIAAETGHSESSIHGLHHRGRRALRAELVRLDAAPVTGPSSYDPPLIAA